MQKAVLMIDSQLRIFRVKKLAGWMDGRKEGRKEGWKSRVKDCLQQLKIIFKASNNKKLCFQHPGFQVFMLKVTEVLV